MPEHNSSWLRGKNGNEIGLYTLTFVKPQPMGAEAILSL